MHMQGLAKFLAAYTYKHDITSSCLQNMYIGSLVLGPLPKRHDIHVLLCALRRKKIFLSSGCAVTLLRSNNCQLNLSHHENHDVIGSLYRSSYILFYHWLQLYCNDTDTILIFEPPIKDSTHPYRHISAHHHSVINVLEMSKSNQKSN